MNPMQHLQDMLFLAAFLSLLAGVAQTRALFLAPPPIHVDQMVDGAIAGLTWHMLEMAKNEQAEAGVYPRD